VDDQKPVIAIIGGTGDLGSGLARLWAAAGYRVVLGSRDQDKARIAAQQLSRQAGVTVSGADNRAAAAAAGIVVLCVPYSNHDAMVEEIRPALAGKILIDAVVPLMRLLGVDVRVASAFHNVGAKKLHNGEKADCDVLVFSDDGGAREQAIELANVVATRGVHGGVLANSVAAEALTSVLIAINRRYKIAGAGIRITGLPASDAQ
jgi:predicted dinucleotide-binding enzyme